MKFPDFKTFTREKFEEGALDSLEKRTVFLHELEKHYFESAVKFLFLINAGGSIAVLGFMASTS